MQQRLELRGKHHIDQDDRQGEGKQEAVHGLLAFLFFSGDGNRIVVRQVDIFHGKPYIGGNTVERVSGVETGGHLTDTVLVTAEDLLRRL